jgi:hypothetical protein
LYSEHPAAMNIFKVTIRKFVSAFGVLSVALVDSQMPLCVFTEAMPSNKLILEFGRRPVFGPGAFIIWDNMTFVYESSGESEGVLV